MQTGSLPGKAVIFTGVGNPFEIKQSPLPVIKEKEILVKNIYTTICGSDVHTYCGRRQEPEQVVLGHEIVGDILQIGSGHSGIDLRGEELRVGDRVVWCIFSVPEGNEAPREDIPQKSSNLFKYGHALANEQDVFNGGLADYCVLRNYTAIIKIDKNIPVQVAATISCAHATIAGALRVAGNIQGKRVLIMGAGMLGLSCSAMCKEAGAAAVEIVDIDERRATLSYQFGADAAYKMPAKEAAFPWHNADIVFDITGDTYAMECGLNSLRIGGVIVFIGAVFPNKPVAVNAEQVVRKILQIRGLHNYNYDDFLNATIFIENNFQKYPFQQLVEKEFALEQTQEAFEFAVNNKPVRAGVFLK
jgi:alcohol dehydrogenase